MSRVFVWQAAPSAKGPACRWARHSPRASRWAWRSAGWGRWCGCRAPCQHREGLLVERWNGVQREDAEPGVAGLKRNDLAAVVHQLQAHLRRRVALPLPFKHLPVPENAGRAVQPELNLKAARAAALEVFGHKVILVVDAEHHHVGGRDRVFGQRVEVGHQRAARVFVLPAVIAPAGGVVAPADVRCRRERLFDVGHRRAAGGHGQREGQAAQRHALEGVVTGRGAGAVGAGEQGIGVVGRLVAQRRAFAVVGGLGDQPPYVVAGKPCAAAQMVHGAKAGAGGDQQGLEHRRQLGVDVAGRPHRAGF